MKQLKYNILFLCSTALMLAFYPAQAQFELDARESNVAQQPEWGPIGFNYVSSYYLPAYNIYYEVSEKNFLIKEGRKWVKYQALPRKYAKIDLYTTYKIVLQDGSKEPYTEHKKHREDIPKTGTTAVQVPILDAVKFDDRYK